MLYFWRGCRGNLKSIAFGSERDSPVLLTHSLLHHKWRGNRRTPKAPGYKIHVVLFSFHVSTLAPFLSNSRSSPKRAIPTLLPQKYSHAQVLTDFRAERLGEVTSAHVINLISKDLEPISFAANYICMALTGLIEVPVACFILWLLVAPEAVAGFALVLLIWIFQTKMKSVLETLRNQTALLTDQRLRIITDIVLSIRVVKMNCWEKSFEEIASARRRWNDVY